MEPKVNDKVASLLTRLGDLLEYLEDVSDDYYEQRRADTHVGVVEEVRDYLIINCLMQEGGQ